MIVDLSQTISNSMPAFSLRGPDGVLRPFRAEIRPFLTHEQSRPNYDGLAEFEITEIRLQTSLGTYLDAPRHRFREGRDIAALGLDSLILEGVVIDATCATPERPFGLEDLPAGLELRGKAVLFYFGWDRFWGADDYFRYPFLNREVLRHLVEAGAGLVGVDTINLDSSADKERPAHTWLLGAGTHIVENLTGLGGLVGKTFRFFAIPAKVEGAAAFPVRAFADVAD